MRTNTVSTKELGRLVALLGATRPTRNRYLQHVHVHAAGMSFSLTTTDYDTFARVGLEQVAGDGAPFDALVSFDTLKSAVAGMPKRADSVAHFSVGESGTLELHCGDMATTLEDEGKAEDYPATPIVGAESVGVGVLPLGTWAKNVAGAAGKGDMLPTLRSVHVEGTGSELVASATDRFRLAQQRHDHYGPEFTGLFYAPLMVALAKVSSTWIVELDSSVGSQWHLADISEDAIVDVWHRGPEGSFPKVSRLFPTDAPRRFTVQAKGAADTIKRIGATSGNKQQPVDLSRNVSGTGITVASEHSSTTLGAVVHDDVEVRYNSSFLASGLAPFGTSSVTVSYVEPTRPALLESDDVKGLRWLVMPLRKAD